MENENNDTSVLTKPNHYPFVSHNEQVHFIIDNGIKVRENESLRYINLAQKNHSIIEFYGIKYYIPMCDIESDYYNVFQFLIKNYKQDYNKIAS